MSQSGDAEIVQAKITAARREAEGLKDKIKRKKDDLTDATRKSRVSEHWLGNVSTTLGSAMVVVLEAR